MDNSKRPLDRVREEYEEKRRVREEETRRRRAEVEEAIPAVRGMNAYLEGLGLRILRVAMQGGDIQTAMRELRAENEKVRRERDRLLVQNGFPADYDQPHYDCDRCRDRGFVKGEMCECMRRRVTEEGMRASGLSALLKKQSFSNFSLDYYRTNEQFYGQMRVNLENAQTYVREFGSEKPSLSRNLLLIGGTGLGKTHLSTAIAKEIIARGFDVLYNSAIGMLSDFETARFGSGIAEGERGNVPRYTQCDLLIVDDLGTEVTNQFSESCLYHVLNTRLNLDLPTIVNTNLNGNELRKRYSDRITSRFLGDFLIMPFNGKDVRQQKI